MEMRRKDRSLPKDEALSLLENGEYGILSTVGQDKEPYGTPLSYALGDKCIFIHGAAGCGRKFLNIDANSQVCFTVVGKTAVLAEKFSTKYESVIIQGKAKKLTGEEKKFGLYKLIEKYSSDYLESGRHYIVTAADKTDVYQINITSLSGKARR